MTVGNVGVVAIGRNEGARLIACLRSALRDCAHVVYVDSGSSDGSVAAARELGAEIVELDLSRPFTAARARNAGFEALRASAPDIEFVQFVDGDCELREGWVAAAAADLTRNGDWGIVTGRLVEKHRNATIYNMMCDVEWHGPAGDIAACGGIMMVRRSSFEAVEGFDPEIIAAEDDDFCLRVASRRWRIRRLPLDMATHDAAMTTFGHWWRRAVRAGHAVAQGNLRHPTHFGTALRRTWIWGFVLPALAIVGGVLISPWIPLAVMSLYGLSFLKILKNLLDKPLGLRDAVICATFTTLSKFPGMQGVFVYCWRKFAGRGFHLIEHRPATGV